LDEHRCDFLIEIYVVKMSNKLVSSAKNRFRVISNYLGQIIYIKEEKQLVKYGTLRNTTTNFPPFRKAVVIGILTCYYHSFVPVCEIRINSLDLPLMP